MVNPNASTSVTFTHTQKVAVIDVLAQWMNEPREEEIGEGLFKLRNALTDDLDREQADSRTQPFSLARHRCPQSPLTRRVAGRKHHYLGRPMTAENCCS